MVRLHVCLTLALTLLLLGNGAWIPASHTAASDSLVPAGLTAVDWQAIQSQVANLTTTDGLMGPEFRNPVAVSGDTAVVSGTAHVGGISMGYKASGIYFYNVLADVLILDQGGQPVNKAMVYIIWTLHRGDEEGYPLVQHGNTDKNGHAVLGLRAGLVGTWEVCVDKVVKSGWYYDSNQNIETCDALEVP
jgi:hypothetical protein